MKTKVKEENRQSKRLEIFKNVVDVNKTGKENLLILSKNGVNISITTYYKYYNWTFGPRTAKSKNEMIIALNNYDPALTYQANSRLIFDKTGVNVSPDKLCMLVNPHNKFLYDKKYKMVEKSLIGHIVLNKEDTKTSTSRYMFNDFLESYVTKNLINSKKKPKIELNIIKLWLKIRESIIFAIDSGMSVDEIIDMIKKTLNKQAIKNYKKMAKNVGSI